jgi:negative regulator of flagellin synthesis FlgM
MKIPTYLNLQISNAYLQQSRAPQRKNNRDVRDTLDGIRSSEKLKKDEIIFSPRATEILELEGQAKSIPEVRQEKVESVREQIESRTYNVDGKLVAKNIADLLN